ncbi:MAG: hypothetical protein JST54_15195 [Deltaproteobacteria bacterium]|nr:hypothetical protein [Deltaproteobacteria bacterium]
MFKSLVVVLAVVTFNRAAVAESTRITYPDSWAAEGFRRADGLYTRMAPQHTVGELVPTVTVTPPEKLLGERGEWFTRAIRRMEADTIVDMQVVGETDADGKHIAIVDSAVRAADGSERVVRWFMVTDDDWAAVVFVSAESEKVMNPFTDDIVGIVKSVEFHASARPAPAHARVLELPTAPAPTPTPTPSSAPAPVPQAKPGSGGVFRWPSLPQVPANRGPVAQPSRTRGPVAQPSRTNSPPPPPAAHAQNGKVAEKNAPPPPGKKTDGKGKAKSLMLAKLGF